MQPSMVRTFYNFGLHILKLVRAGFFFCAIILFLSVVLMPPVAKAIVFSFNNALVDAADDGDKLAVMRYLKAGQAVDGEGSFKTTALMRAAFRGNREIAEILIGVGAYINARDIGGETPLHLAARNGHLDVVKLLVEADAEINVQDKEKWTPLMRSVVANEKDIVKYLVDAGADVSQENDLDESALVHATVSDAPDIVEILVNSKQFTKVSEEQKDLALQLADSKGYDDVKKVLTKSWSLASVKAIPDKEIKTTGILGKEKDVIAGSERSGVGPTGSVGSRIREFGDNIDKEISELEARVGGAGEKLPPSVVKPVPLQEKKKWTLSGIFKSKKADKPEEKMIPIENAQNDIVHEPEKKAVDKDVAEEQSFDKILEDDSDWYEIDKNYNKEISQINNEVIEEERLIEPEEDKPVKEETVVSSEAVMEPVSSEPDIKDIPSNTISAKTDIKNGPSISRLDSGIFDPSESFKPVDSKSNENKPENKVQADNTGRPAKSLGDDSSSYLLQLGAYHSDEEAMLNWEDMKEKNPGILNGKRPKVVKSFLSGNGGIVYRLRVGAYDKRNQAKRDCDSLRSRDMECFIVETTGDPYETAKKEELDSAAIKNLTTDVPWDSAAIRSYYGDMMASFSKTRLEAKEPVPEVAKEEKIEPSDKVEQPNEAEKPKEVASVKEEVLPEPKEKKIVIEKIKKGESKGVIDYTPDEGLPWHDESVIKKLYPPQDEPEEKYFDYPDPKKVAMERRKKVSGGLEVPDFLRRVDEYLPEPQLAEGEIVEDKAPEQEVKEAENIPQTTTHGSYGNSFASLSKAFRKEQEAKLKRKEEDDDSLPWVNPEDKKQKSDYKLSEVKIPETFKSPILEEKPVMVDPAEKLPWKSASKYDVAPVGDTVWDKKLEDKLPPVLKTEEKLAKPEIKEPAEPEVKEVAKAEPEKPAVVKEADKVAKNIPKINQDEVLPWKSGTKVASGEEEIIWEEGLPAITTAAAPLAQDTVAKQSVSGVKTAMANEPNKFPVPSLKPVIVDPNEVLPWKNTDVSQVAAIPSPIIAEPVAAKPITAGAVSDVATAKAEPEKSVHDVAREIARGVDEDSYGIPSAKKDVPSPWKKTTKTVAKAAVKEVAKPIVSTPVEAVKQVAALPPVVVGEGARQVIEKPMETIVDKNEILPWKAEEPQLTAQAQMDSVHVEEGKPLPIIKSMKDEYEAAAIEEDIRNKSREEFFAQQGISMPQEEESRIDYKDFYKELEDQPKKIQKDLDKSPVSEAVLVPNDAYFVKNSGGESPSMPWKDSDEALHATITGFTNDQQAADYWDRMFAYDNEYSSLKMTIVREAPASPIVMKVTNLKNDGADLCQIVKTSGYGCSVSGAPVQKVLYEDNPFKGSVAANGKNRDYDFEEFWINLGTFADMSQGEYYWMYLLEDNNDILSSMKFNMVSVSDDSAISKESKQLRVGPFAEKNRASQICSILRYRNVACLIVQ